MLTLTRKIGESIVIGDDIQVVVRSVRGRAVRLGIETPRGMRIVRLEILDSVREHNRQAALTDAAHAVRELLNPPSETP